MKQCWWAAVAVVCVMAVSGGCRTTSAQRDARTSQGPEPLGAATAPTQPGPALSTPYATNADGYWVRPATYPVTVSPHPSSMPESVVPAPQAQPVASAKRPPFSWPPRRPEVGWTPVGDPVPVEEDR